MTEVSRKFRRLARLGGGVIVLHHDNKNGVGYRGSTAIPAGSDMAIKIAKNEKTDVIEIRTERFRMCEKWDMDIIYDFKTTPWSVKVLKDKTAKDSYEKESTDEMETVAVILANYHEENDGAGMNKTQLLSMLQAADISKAPALALLAKGVREDKWKFKPATRNNAILYSLTGWKPEETI